MPDRVRTYRSPLRDEQARRTRLRIVDAARAAFCERGYGATRLADVARAAGVAEPTVRAVFGTKRRLLEAVVLVAVRGDDDAEFLARREALRHILAAETVPDVLDRVTALSVGIQERSWDVVDMVRSAATTDPSVAALHARRGRDRRNDMEAIAARIAELRGDAGAVDDRLVDLLWFYTAPDSYRMLVVERRWPPERYAAWLRDALGAAAG